MTLINGRNTLLVYLDEAGDTHFGNSGTKYFFYTGLVLTGDGFPLHKALLECRYATLATQGRFSNSHESNDYFHATEDSLETRENVFRVLKAHSDDVRVYATVLEKKAFALDHQTPEKLFEAAAKNLLSELVNAEVHKASYEHISVMLDSIPVQKKRKSIIGTLKRTLAATLDGSGITFTVMPMASKSDLALQAVDYYSWAIYRSWESNDPSQLARLGKDSARITQAALPSKDKTTSPAIQKEEQRSSYRRGGTFSLTSEHVSQVAGLPFLDFIELFSVPPEELDLQVHPNTLVSLSNSAGHVRLSLGKSLLEARAQDPPER